MSEPGRTDSQGDTAEARDRTPEDLANALRAEARAAATMALRKGLEAIDERYGMYVAEEVVGLIDIADLYAGLIDEEQNSRDDEPYELKSYIC